MKKRLLLVDGMALLFRGFYATAYRNRYMYTKSGIPTNGVFQFLRYFFDAIDFFHPTHVICCWDLSKETFRTELYPSYKANREDPPEELIPQFDLMKEVTSILHVPNMSLDNYEADDCMGTLAERYKDTHEVLLLTGDLDMLQLVKPQIKVAIMRKGIGNYEVFHEDNFYDKIGLTPEQMIDFKALVGDPADHYPGIKGIGEVTAKKLLQKYHSIENILKNIDHLTETMQQRISSNLETLKTFQKLARIKRNLPLDCTISEAVWSFDQPINEEKLKALELDHLLPLMKANELKRT